MRTFTIIFGLVACGGSSRESPRDALPPVPVDAAPAPITTSTCAPGTVELDEPAIIECALRYVEANTTWARGDWRKHAKIDAQKAETDSEPSYWRVWINSPDRPPSPPMFWLNVTPTGTVTDIHSDW